VYYWVTCNELTRANFFNLSNIIIYFLFFFILNQSKLSDKIMLIANFIFFVFLKILSSLRHFFIGEEIWYGIQGSPGPWSSLIFQVFKKS
jgi:hypothetical protein